MSSRLSRMIAPSHGVLPGDENMALYIARTTVVTAGAIRLLEN